MNSGQLFEMLVKKMLLNAGFSTIIADNFHVFNGTAGQMIQGLGQAHNADVLMAPPVQTPFYFPSRILFECKNYKTPATLNVVRSALGLREDINSFEIVDEKVLLNRRINKRSSITYDYKRYYYQVGVASFHGFTIQAQEFALAHRIPLISFDKLPFWKNISPYLENLNRKYIQNYQIERNDLDYFEYLCDEIARKTAIAILDDGQMLFLYDISDGEVNFPDNYYGLEWNNQIEYWTMSCGNKKYAFQLPEKMREGWLANSIDARSLKENAILCKEQYLSHIVVYYTRYGMAEIKMLSIDSELLKRAYDELFNLE